MAFSDTFLDQGPEIQIVREIGDDFHKRLSKPAAEVARMIDAKAKAQGVSPVYVRYLLLRQRETWRGAVGRNFLGLSIALALWKNHHRPDARVYALPPSEDEAKVDKAIMEIAKWASGPFVKSLIKPYNDAVLARLGDIQKVIKVRADMDLSRRDALLYLRGKLKEALRKRPHWFEHPAELQAILQKLFVKGSDTSSPI